MIPFLAFDSVHLHWIHLNRPSPIFDGVDALLNDAERERVDRFHFEKDRRDWIASRGTLKKILGFYLGMNPREIHFRMGINGKPELDRDRHSGSNLHFNISHSHERLLLGFSRISPIGVDVEFIKQINDMDRLVSRFFSEIEYDQWSRGAQEDRLRNFYCIWTKKEAFIKASGEGLSRNLKSFAVSLDSEEKSLLCSNGEGIPRTDWHLEEVKFEGDYIASFCLAEKPRRICTFDSRFHSGLQAVLCNPKKF